MNILIYIPYLAQDWGGVRQYTIGLLKLLSKDAFNHYFIYHNSEDESILWFRQHTQNFTFISDGDVILSAFEKQLNRGKRLYNFFARIAKIKDTAQILPAFDKLCIQYKIDVVHCPYQFIPHTNKARLITTLHDVQEIHFPGHFTPAQRAYRATSYLDFLTRAHQIIVSYQHVKNDLIKYFQVPDDKVQVVLLDMGQLWFEKYALQDALPVAGLGAPEKYLLYPANTWEHKNHIRLLEAVALLRDQYNTKVSVVCTGHLNDFFHNKIRPALEQLGLEEQVLFLGVVTEQDLYSLYRSALGVVVPTYYEAGSFPLMESILLHIPVICANVTSLSETIRNHEFLFDPFRVPEMALKIKELWTSECFRKRSMENSEKVGPFLRQTNALEKLKRIYSQLSDA